LSAIDNLVAEARAGRDGDLESLGLTFSAAWPRRSSSLEGVQTGLALGLAGLGRHADPLELVEPARPVAARSAFSSALEARRCFCSSHEE
jgi:hypothetical protein